MSGDCKLVPPGRVEPEGLQREAGWKLRHGPTCRPRIAKNWAKSSSRQPTRTSNRRTWQLQLARWSPDLRRRPFSRCPRDLAMRRDCGVRAPRRPSCQAESGLLDDPTDARPATIDTSTLTRALRRSRATSLIRRPRLDTPAPVSDSLFETVLYSRHRECVRGRPPTRDDPKPVWVHDGWGPGGHAPPVPERPGLLLEWRCIEVPGRPARWEGLVAVASGGGEAAWRLEMRWVSASQLRPGSAPNSTHDHDAGSA